MVDSQKRTRVTIADIARRAGVSKGAVSYALNGRPGISDDTRRRILALADDLGWYPNSAARALSAAQARACGLAIARPPSTLASEPFFMELIAGIESELSSRSMGLMLQFVPDVEAEMDVYQRWWAERRVDGVLLVDLLVDDPRIDLVTRLGLPAAVIGGPDGVGELAAVWSQDVTTMQDIVRYLARLGHTRLARVAGVAGFRHTAERTETFLRTSGQLGLDATVVDTDYLRESGARATRRLLTDPVPPTAIIYDNDVLAVAGLGVAHELGLSVAEDLSLIAWDDSLYCQVVHPPLTAITRDIPAYGAAAAAALLTLLETGEVVRRAAPLGALTPRGSTGTPPGPGGRRPASHAVGALLDS